MTYIIIIVFIIWFFGFHRNDDEKTNEARERFLYNFIRLYAAETGDVLTRKQAIDLIRVVADIKGPDLIPRLQKEIESENAQATVARICAEAEQQFRRSHQN